MNRDLLNSLQAHFHAKFLRARANLNVYMTSSVGVGEHGDIVEECVKHVEEMEHSRSCVELLSEIIETLEKQPEQQNPE